MFTSIPKTFSIFQSAFFEKILSKIFMELLMANKEKFMDIFYLFNLKFADFRLIQITKISLIRFYGRFHLCLFFNKVMQTTKYIFSRIYYQKLRIKKRVLKKQFGAQGF